jgi:hypothetical protein
MLTCIQVQTGRFYCALSLTEAETLRGILHARHRAPLVDGSDQASVALRVLAPGGQHAEVLDSSAGHPASPHSYQTDIARNCFRFMDSQVRESWPNSAHCDAPQSTLLTWTVRPQPPE